MVLLFGRSTEHHGLRHLEEAAITVRSEATRARILDAARIELLASGFADLSTRGIAERAGVPLSQIHYHFGSKKLLVLALLDRENAQRLERQTVMYGADVALSVQWDQACDHLEDDLASGYVRVLQEMVAAGWSDGEVANAVCDYLRGWHELLTGVAEEFGRTHDALGPFSGEEAATFVGMAFLGAEAAILLGLDEDQYPSRAALRRVGDLIRIAEAHAATGTVGSSDPDSHHDGGS